MASQQQKWLFRAAALVVLGILAIYAWQRYAAEDVHDGLVSGNGRIEAVEIDVAAKTPGRIAEILVEEGEFVRADQTVARMDSRSLEARYRQAEAELHQAEQSVTNARSQLVQRQSEKAAAEALVVQRQAELSAMQKRARRIAELAEKGAVSAQEADDANANVQSAAAALSAARAQVAATEAAIATARSQIDSARSAVEAARAAVERIQSDIDDSTLVAPRDGRVQFIVARPGEVIGAGGRVLNLVDLTDVYMTFFLPTAVAGRLAIGTEARIVLDAAPEYVIPAHISFVADVAQFTPKTVETASEREKLMFRVRARIPRELLNKYIERVKTGLPGVAYVRLDPEAPWPDHLQHNLVQ
ncbi:HlyD family secretion protein [Thiohalophilus thiocyanatoxydans]|uniref:HlyD family secretion protein n=1 Tax=Thiohalophilus thiocyanatoxydans TaxID=381308 RepID=A0A4R8INB2_9GAMM|nr:HlyD family efflux transporter periplasmic adaptor subunit [Thiohalophilus thiocyanatoxydans]TDY00610.1 HlyD family secretion protein [Thiohalophilus thiocyanatoxydans]